MGVWMALGAGHAFVFLVKLVYDYRPHEISLGGRLLKPLPKSNMSMKGHKQNVTPMLTYNPNENWPRFLVVEAADGNPKPLTDQMTFLHGTKLLKEWADHTNQLNQWMMADSC